jgi:hypothetical protein
LFLEICPLPNKDPNIISIISLLIGPILLWTRTGTGTKTGTGLLDFTFLGALLIDEQCNNGAARIVL